MPRPRTLLPLLLVLALLIALASAAPAGERVVGSLRAHGEACAADLECLAGTCCRGVCAAECGGEKKALEKRQDDDDDDDDDGEDGEDDDDDDDDGY
ncbi:hypothetical protein DFJ74DRAFT_691671 [Hyaloraphidium curvatum]|nr:hypothetical protein DFJ74DRAFT_691671 [Hyaloraphidium curvatum]